MAGQLKRDNPILREDVVLIRALRDSNLPKFLADDSILFRVRSASCARLLIHERRGQICCTNSMISDGLMQEGL